MVTYPHIEIGNVLLKKVDEVGITPIQEQIGIKSNAPSIFASMKAKTRETSTKIKIFKTKKNYS